MVLFLVFVVDPAIACLLACVLTCVHAHVPVVALVRSVQPRYSEVAAVLKKQRHRCRRTAIVAAFMVLDESADNTLDQRECQGFFRE